MHICPFLVGMYMQSCSAGEDVYIPSRSEFAEYCHQSGHRTCRIYMMAGSSMPSVEREIKEDRKAQRVAK